MSAYRNFGQRKGANTKAEAQLKFSKRHERYRHDFSILSRIILARPTSP